METEHKSITYPYLPFSTHALLTSRPLSWEAQNRSSFTVSPFVLAVAKSNAHVVIQSRGRCEVIEAASSLPQIYDAFHTEGFQITLCHVANTWDLKLKKAVSSEWRQYGIKNSIFWIRMPDYRKFSLFFQ